MKNTFEKGSNNAPHSLPVITPDRFLGLTLLSALSAVRLINQKDIQCRVVAADTQSGIVLVEVSLAPAPVPAPLPVEEPEPEPTPVPNPELWKGTPPGSRAVVLPFGHAPERIMCIVGGDQYV